MNAADRARAKAGTATRLTVTQNLDHYRQLGQDAPKVTRARIAELMNPPVHERGRAR